MAIAIAIFARWGWQLGRQLGEQGWLTAQQRVQVAGQDALNLVGRLGRIQLLDGPSNQAATAVADHVECVRP